MNIITFFTADGAPAPELSPNITIRKVSTKEVVKSAQLMSEIGEGFYIYDFTEYTEGEIFTVLVDGGSTLQNNERYQHGILQDVDINSAVSFIKEIESGKWELKDNQMVFYKSDNKSELMRFNLYNEQGQASMSDVFKRTKYYDPTSGEIVFYFADLLSKTGSLLIPEGIYHLIITIDEFPIDIGIPILPLHTLNDLISNIQIAIRNATQKQETVFQDSDQIHIKSSTTGYNSNVKNPSGTLISEAFLLLGYFSNLTEEIAGYGTEGPL